MFVLRTPKYTRVRQVRSIAQWDYSEPVTPPFLTQWISSFGGIAVEAGARYKAERTLGHIGWLARSLKDYSLSNAEQDWIEKYRAALLASAQTKEPRFRSVVKAIFRALAWPLRKLSDRIATVPTAHSPATKIGSSKDASSQPQKKAS